MAKKKLGIRQMEINKKFDSYEDACRYAKNFWICFICVGYSNVRCIN